MGKYGWNLFTAIGALITALLYLLICHLMGWQNTSVGFVALAVMLGWQNGDKYWP